MWCAVIIPGTKRLCVKCHWFLCLGFWGALLVLGFWNLAFCHWRLVLRSPYIAIKFRSGLSQAGRPGWSVILLIRSAIPWFHSVWNFFVPKKSINCFVGADFLIYLLLLVLLLCYIVSCANKTGCCILAWDNKTISLSCCRLLNSGSWYSVHLVACKAWREWNPAWTAKMLFMKRPFL